MEVLDDLLPVGSIDLRTRAKPLSPLTSPVTPALADWLPFPPGIVPQDPTGPITTTNWLPFTPDIIPYDSTDPTIKTTGDLILALAQLTKTNHIRATCQRLTQLHDPAAYVWYRVRVYIVPEHVRRRRNIGATQKADKLLPLIYQRYLDTRKSVFEGEDTEPVEVPVCLLPPEEPMKLVDLYLGMPSPAPDPESIRAHPQALPDTLRLLDECLSRPAPRGMTTTLYQYQKACIHHSS
ncbi:hypothetical protein BC938DRAFT_483885 [Jimgerdemannia flammicorona]|uniref:Uncharacterized protein n=1 Tax=Jimgerdemannia flammicorona TaxID=994334 RepID=A0A433QB65_9FUNG|nr:hypothetical protein BC938DRAFT_483885 [Jimgerdemannia flammicorona]